MRSCTSPRSIGRKTARKDAGAVSPSLANAPSRGGGVSDEIILQPLMDFMRSPDTRNFKELMRDCLENFFRSCRDDCEYCESEEYFTDESHKNNWEYLIDGTLFIETA